MNLTVRDAIIQRRSVKSFTDQPIQQEEIIRILEDATWAPNHGNRNPWRFIVATGEANETLVDVIKEFAVPNWKQLDEETLAKQLHKFRSIGGVAFVIVPEDVRQKERLEDFGAASALIQNAQLLALDRGIGSCWKTPPFLDHPKFRERLGVQSGERVISMLQFGYAAVESKAKERVAIDELITIFK